MQNMGGSRQKGNGLDGWLISWEISVPFQYKIGYSGDKVLSRDLVPPG